MDGLKNAVFCIILIVFSTFTILARNAAQADDTDLLSTYTPTQLIDIQRNWADSIFANPEKLDNLKLIDYATSIIAINMQDESAINLLDVFGSRIPALRNYAKMQRNCEIDTAFNKTISALKGLSDYASNNFPNTKEAFKSRYQYAYAKSAVNGDDSELSNLIKALTAVCKKSDNIELKAILYLSKLAVINNNLIVNPSLFSDIFEIEKKVLKIYPWESDDFSMLRAELYFALGKAKYIIQYSELATIELKLHGRIPGMNYILTGDSGNYPCNSLDYYHRTISISSKILNVGHPWVRTAVETEYELKDSLYNIGDDFVLRKNIHDYNVQYYGDNSIEKALCRITSSITNRLLNDLDIDCYFVDKALEVIRLSLGEYHPTYCDNLINLYETILQTGSEDELSRWTEQVTEYFEKSEKSCFTEEINYRLAQTMIHLYYYLGESIKEDIDQLKTAYIEGHEPNIVDIAIACDLYNFYDTLKDRNSATQIINLAVSDSEKLAEKDKSYQPLLWELKLWQVSYQTVQTPNDTDNIYGVLYDELNRQNFKQRDYFKYLLEFCWAGNKRLIGDFENAYSLMRHALEYVKNEPNEWIPALGHLTSYSQRVQRNKERNKEDVDRLVNQAIDEVNCIVQNKRYGEIRFYVLDLIIDYLKSEGRYDDALKLCNNQIELYENQYLSNESIDYYSIKHRLASIYEGLDEINQANRIYASIEANLDKLYDENPTTDLLDILWEDYNRINKKPNEVTWEKGIKLAKIGNLTVTISQLNNHDTEFIYTYGVRMISECLRTFAHYDFPENIDDIPEEAIKKSSPFNNKAQYNDFRDNLLSQAEEIKDSFKDYDVSYMTNFHYIQLVDAISIYYDAAKKDTKKSLELEKELLVPGMSDSYNFIRNESIAWKCFSLNDIANADKYLQIALNTASDLNDLNSSDLVTLNALQYEIDAAKKEYDSALEYARKIFELNKSFLDNNFQLMTSSEQSGYQNTMGDPAIYLLRIVEQFGDEISGEVYDAIVYRTGMQLRSQRETRRALERSDDPQIKVLLDSLTSLKSRIETINATSNNITDLIQYTDNQQLLSDYSKQANRIERQLLDATAHLRNASRQEIKWQEIRNRLKTGEAAIEFMFSQNYTMALIITPECKQPIAVKLSPTQDLWKFINSFKAKNSAALAKCVYGADNPTLYKLLWKPLETELEGINTIYYSASGILSSLSFNAFVDDKGEYLFDKYNLIELTTTAQLVTDHEQPELKTISVMGDILYFPTQKITDVNHTEEVQGVSASHFHYLPSSKIEIEEITKLFPEDAVDKECRLNATEKRLYEMIETKPDILHLSTHGYYVSGNDKIDEYPFFKKKGWNSMLRSGVALAGAEYTWKGISDEPDDNDGIVTAQEFSDLDMKKTELVVLSACETALGDTSFEGVFGLQRGFKQAGVSSLLVSLWIVEAKSTALFMSTFYKALLTGNETSRQQAWRKAVNEVRQKYPQPYYWAPFIMLDGI